MTVTIQIPYESGIPEKLELLNLERGVSINGFIVRALAEKLKRDGFITESHVEQKKTERKTRKRDISFDMKWIMEKRKH